MTWEIRLIAIYELVCSYKYALLPSMMRLSNHSEPAFSDEEIMTIYLFGTMDELKLHTKKSIYTYADRHLRSWFPRLPKYEDFNHRVNRLGEVFRLFSGLLLEKSQQQYTENQKLNADLLVDSLPIMLAKGKRADNAKVATEIAKKGYCATKDMYYFGFKLHTANLKSEQATNPILHSAVVTNAAVHDMTALKNELLPLCKNSTIYADKAYFEKQPENETNRKFNVTIKAIKKRVRGQKELSETQKVENTEISKTRQPVESYYNWLIEKVNIQNAAKCRSLKGVLTHIYGKLAAAITFYAIFNF